MFGKEEYRLKDLKNLTQDEQYIFCNYEIII